MLSPRRDQDGGGRPGAEDCSTNPPAVEVWRVFCWEAACSQLIRRAVSTPDGNRGIRQRRQWADSHCRGSAGLETMAPKEPQPCVEGTEATRTLRTVESGACPGQWHGREGAYITVDDRRTPTTQGRVAHSAIQCERADSLKPNGLIQKHRQIERTLLLYGLEGALYRARKQRLRGHGCRLRASDAEQIHAAGES